LVPALPFFSMALALAFHERAALLAALMLVHAYTSWPSVIRRYSPNGWILQRKIPVAAALRVESTDHFLNHMTPDYALVRMIEDHVPQGSRVFAMSGVFDAYTSREVLVSFQAGKNQTLSETIAMGWDSGRRPSRAWTFHFPATNARRMRI